MDVNYEASNISLLLHNLENSERKDKIKILKNIGLVLASKDSMKVEFHKQGGNDIVMKYLQDFDWKISGTAFHILQEFICQSLENKLVLTTKHMFQQMLQILKHGTVNHKKSCLYFVASIVNGNVLGQTLIRESGCLDYLLYLCHETLQITSPVEEDYLQFLCTAIKMCVNSPQNFTNQYQTSLIIPKAIRLLDNWFHQAFNKHFSEYVHIITGLLISIIAGNPTNQLCFSVYSGIKTIGSGLSLLNDWQDPPLNVTDVLEKLIILLDTAIHNNSTNCEQAALEGVIPLLLKMLPKFKEQQIFSLLMLLVHLVSASSDNKKKFIEESGITTVVLATINLKDDSKIGNAASFLIKLCADTVLQQNKQKENCDLLGFEHRPKKQNDRRKLTPDKNIAHDDSSREQQDTSKITNKQPQTADINTVYSCDFPSRSQDKLGSPHKMAHDSNKTFTITGNEDTASYCTPLEQRYKTVQNQNLGEGISLGSCTAYHIAPTSQATMNICSCIATSQTNISTDNRFHSPVLQRQNNKHQLLPETADEFLHILKKKSGNVIPILGTPSSKTTMNSKKNTVFPIRNENICQMTPKQEQNPNITSQINKNHLVYENNLPHNIENRSQDIHVRTPLLKGRYLQSDKQSHFVSGQTKIPYSIDDYCKNTQNNTDVQSKPPDVDVPALTEECRITVKKMTMSPKMMLAKEQRTIPQSFRNPDFQTNTALRTDTQQFNSESKHISCKVSKENEIYNPKDDNPETNVYSGTNMHHNTSNSKQKIYSKNTSQSIHSDMSQILHSEHNNKMHSVKKYTSDMRLGSFINSKNNDIYSRTSQSKHNTMEINSELKNNTSSTNKISHNKISNQNNSTTLQFPCSEYVQSIYSGTNEGNITSSTKKDSRENIKQNIHPVASQFSHCELNLSEIDKQINSTRIKRRSPHHRNINREVHSRISQFAFPKHHLGAGNSFSEINLQHNTSKRYPRNIHSEINIQHSTPKQIIGNAYSQINDQKNTPKLHLRNAYSDIIMLQNTPKQHLGNSCTEINMQQDTPKQHLGNICSKINMQQSTLTTRKVCHNKSTNENIHPESLKFPHYQKYADNQLQSCQNNFSNNLLAYNNNNNHEITFNCTSDKIEFSSNSGNSQFHRCHKRMNKTEKERSGLAVDGNLRMRKNGVIYHSVGDTGNGEESVFITPLPKTCKYIGKTDNINHCLSHLNATGQRNVNSQDLLHSFDRTQNSQQSIRSSSFNVRTSANVPKKPNSKNEIHHDNMESLSIFGENKSLNLSLHLGKSPRVNEKDVSGVDLWNDENQFHNLNDIVGFEEKQDYRVPACSTLQQHGVRQQAEKEISHKKQVSRPRHERSFSPMLKYTKMELDNLVAGVSKYGLNFKAIRRAYTFHKKRTSKDLYLKWRNSFINHRRRYHSVDGGAEVSYNCPLHQSFHMVTVARLLHRGLENNLEACAAKKEEPGTRIQDSDYSTATCLQKID